MTLRGLALIVLLACLGCNEPTAIIDRFPQYQPPPPAESPEELIQVLAWSYHSRDLNVFASLLANDPDNRAEFLFILDPAANAPEPQWGYDEMIRIHQRLFEPQNTPPGQTLVPAELWLTSVNITLTHSWTTSRSARICTNQPRTRLVWIRPGGRHRMRSMPPMCCSISRVISISR